SRTSPCALCQRGTTKSARVRLEHEGVVAGSRAPDRDRSGPAVAAWLGRPGTAPPRRRPRRGAALVRAAGWTGDEPARRRPGGPPGAGPRGGAIQRGRRAVAAGQDRPPVRVGPRVRAGG